MIEQPSPKVYDELLSIWEEAVRSTHHFLTEADIQFYKPLIRHEYLAAVRLYIIREDSGTIAAFMGLSNDCIEMLSVRMPMDMATVVGWLNLPFGKNESIK